MKTRADHDQRGMVLVIVLWIVTLLAVMAGGFAYSMRVETRLATSAVERAQARALAEAGVAYALAWQLDLDPEIQKQWPPNGDPHDWEFNGGRIRIRVEDAAGRISLNSADPQLLRKVLTSVGMAETNAESLMAAIADWRDQDDEQTLPGGAESAEYRSAGRAGPKNALFESVEELQQVMGIDRDTAQRLASLVTISMISGINPQLASFAVLRAATGLSEQAVADYVSARTASEEPPPPPPSEDGMIFFSGSRLGVYHIAVTAQAGTGATVSEETVVSIQGPLQGQAVRWLSWRLLAR